MRPTVLVLVVAMGFAVPAHAKGLARDDINAAELSAGKQKNTRALTARAQVLLDRASFSPGAIDGRDSDNFEHALRGFQKKNALPESGKLTKETWEKLAQGAEPALIDYTITEKDTKGPFAEEIPAKYEDKAKLKRLDFTSVAEMLAERFHMDEVFLKELNRGKDFDKAGTVIAVANINVKPVALAPKQGVPKAAKIEADKGNNVVRVLAKDGTLLASYPASIGSDDKPAPSGTLKVVRVAHGPTYTYNPDFKFKGVTAKEKVTIASGPNNPVGSVWIALDQKTYGIHGSSDPSKVGKVDSHGCVRMTNWDAQAIAKIARKGMPVEFID